MKISIYSVHFNKPEFLKLQYEQLVKCCTDDFEFIIINNGKDISLINIISSFCKEHSLKEIRTPHLFEFSTRPFGMAQDHTRSLKYAYDNFVSQDDYDYRIVMDSDVFPLRKFSFVEIIDDCDIAGVGLGESNRRYMVSYMMIYKRSVDLTNVPINTEVNTDMGTWTLSILNKYKSKWLSNTTGWTQREIDYIFKNSDPNLPKCDPTFFCQIIANDLLHYRQGSGWNGGTADYHKRKFEFVLSLIENINGYNMLLDENVHYPDAIVDAWAHQDIYPLAKLIKIE
jgi:glycosyltransferase involved in cell wall biosynthesis